MKFKELADEQVFRFSPAQEDFPAFTIRNRSTYVKMGKRDYRLAHPGEGRLAEVYKVGTINVNVEVA
jgi:hypothetical protein